MTLDLLGIALALVGLAIISLIEAALISMDRVRLHQLIEDGHPTAPLVERLIAQPEKLLGGFVVIINLFVLLAANLATVVVARAWGVKAVPLGNLVVLVLLLVFGEITPKTISLHFVEAIALRTARLAYGINLLFFPLVAVLNAISLGLLRVLTGLHILPGRVHAVPTAFSDEDIKQLLTIGEAGGGVEASEREMIHGVIEFSDTPAGAIMVPRTALTALPIDASLEEAVDAFIDSGHSRIPVYREDTDDIAGVLYIKDLLVRLCAAREAGAPLPTVEELMREAYFVPESKKSDDLLREMQRKRVHLAIVVDEYGGTAGIITIEDLLEEIVGDIIDEYDEDRLDVLPQPDGAMLVDGLTDLEKIEETFDLTLPETEAETISGLITEILGRIPEDGDRVVIGDVAFTVLAVEHNRIARLRAVVLPNHDLPPPESE
jgi:putative hemolysin